MYGLSRFLCLESLSLTKDVIIKDAYDPRVAFSHKAPSVALYTSLVGLNLVHHPPLPKRLPSSDRSQMVTALRSAFRATTSVDPLYPFPSVYSFCADCRIPRPKLMVAIMAQSRHGLSPKAYTPRKIGPVVVRVSISS
jgi:hypothetical protein